MAFKDASSSTVKVPYGASIRYAWPHSVVTNSLTKAEFSALILEASNLTSFHVCDTFICIPCTIILIMSLAFMLNLTNGRLLPEKQHAALLHC